jgi:hypothetical protein
VVGEHQTGKKPCYATGLADAILWLVTSTWSRDRPSQVGTDRDEKVGRDEQDRMNSERGPPVESMRIMMNHT